MREGSPEERGETVVEMICETGRVGKESLSECRKVDLVGWSSHPQKNMLR